jgi:HEPN domain-containing protein
MFLYYHAIELYLKSFLRFHGISAKQLQSIRHNYRSLLSQASKRGLVLGELENEVLSMLDGKTWSRSRYLEIGFFQYPSLSALSETSKSLRQKVAKVLRAARIWRPETMLQTLYDSGSVAIISHKSVVKMRPKNWNRLSAAATSSRLRSCVQLHQRRVAFRLGSPRRRSRISLTRRSGAAAIMAWPSCVRWIKSKARDSAAGSPHRTRSR